MGAAGLDAGNREVVFVPGTPARNGRLAVWSVTGSPDSFTDTLSVVLPAGGSVRQRSVPVTFVDLRDGLDELVALPAGRGSASAQAWAASARGALHLVARGRVLPAVAEDGTDQWRVGPLDREDAAYRDALADALPPVAHATAVAGSAPRRISSPRWLTARFWDAVADAYLRTAAAPVAAGHAAYAGWPGVQVAAPSGRGGGPLGGGAVPAWLAASGSSAEAEATIALRLEDVGDRAEADGPVAAGGATPRPVGAENRPGDAGPEPAPDGEFSAVLEVASVADRSLVLDAAELWSAPDAVAARFGPAVEGDVLLALRRAARIWPPAARLLDQARPDRLVLDGDEVADLLGPVAADLAAGGIDVRWPAEVLASVDLAPVVASPTVGADRRAGLELGALCELRWEGSIDGEALTAQELAQLVAAKRGVVRLRGRWVRADPERLARLSRRRRVRAGEALAVALGGDLVVDGEEVAATVEGPLASLAARLADHERRTAWQPPTGLAAELRPYQRDGAAWLAEMSALGLGGVLADDMGLGKTVQFLALHLAVASDQPTLVVCPVSVLGNWAREAARFAPDVPVVRYHGLDRSLADLAPGSLVITTYGVVRREATLLAEREWALVAADEAQAVKNPLSRTARALRQIPAGARFALTGTPVENRLVDLWSLLDWTTPGLLGPLEHFRREVAVPVERDQDADAAAALARLVRPFLLRRRKADPAIAPDLPPKTETDRIVPLTTEQATLYAALVEEVMAQVEAAEGMERRGLVLKLLTGLKQICNHPAQYLKQPGPLSGRSGKLDATLELVDTITSEGEAVLVFTQYVAMAKLLERHLSDDGRRPVGLLHGGTAVARRQDVVDRFQAGELPVFVVSLKAGGTGLNLTRATHVVHFDRWWNPAVEDQASDRAWRIGQDRPVQVHRMVCEGTVEDKIASLLTVKRSLADAVVTSGEGWVSELGDADLRMLVALGADAADGEGR